MKSLLEKGKPIRKTECQLFNELYRDNAKGIYELAYRKTNNHHDAEDIKQNVFITLLTKIKTVNGHPDPVGWLYKTALYQIEHYWRYMSQKAKVEVDMSNVEEIADNTDLLPGMMGEVMQEHLTQEEREMLLWFYGEGLSLKEIAVRRGITYGTCRVYMAHLRAKLKKILKDN